MKCLSDGTLLLYLDGEMEKVAAEVVYQHLFVCNACSEKRDRIVEIGETIEWFFKKQKLEKAAEEATRGPVVDYPTTEQLQEWLTDVTCPATDGCVVEHDGKCPHGYPSWIMYLGLI